MKMKNTPDKKPRIKLTTLLFVAVSVIVLYQSNFKKPDSVPVQSTDSFENGYHETYTAENCLRLDFIDVGQGDSTLIESPGGKFMLIDTGTNQSSRKMCDYLESRGVSEIEYLIFTHPHEDHIGGGVSAVENFSVKNVLMTKKSANSATYERLIDALLLIKEQNGTKITAPAVSDVYEFDGAEFEILSADGDNDDSNNSSIVLRLTYGDCSFMFTGDAEKKIEKNIISSGKDISCVLLKCGHHGSSTSNCEEFIKAVYPSAAVISCGLDNSYGHPHTETISRLNDIGARIFRTDELGDIVFECDGEKLYYIENDANDENSGNSKAA